MLRAATVAVRAPVAVAAARAVGAATRLSRYAREVRRIRHAGHPHLTIVNKSGYHPTDLWEILLAAAIAAGIRRRVVVHVVASPIYTRGCAHVAGRNAVVAIAPPSRLYTKEGMRRFARLVDHEMLHVRGLDHHQMRESDLYSEGPARSWARPWTSGRKRVRYLRRAPNQL